MKLVAESFAWPFRGRWRSGWLSGLLAVLLVPVAFIPLLGYAIAATRSAEVDAASSPPRWTISIRLLSDGFWTALVIALLTAPFVLTFSPLAAVLFDAHVWTGNDVAVSQLYAHVAAAFLLALPWGLLFLLHMPHATARFAHTGTPIDLFDIPASIRSVVRDFATWNLAAAAIVTAWAIGLACAGLLCVGIVPGVFYAILVSAHASAALHVKGENSPAR
jgi:Protein of unknown function (DUF4013)